MSEIPPPSPDERRQAGRALRKITPRSSLAGFTAPPRRFDPLKVLAQQDRTRIPDLVPIRYGRMAVSSFTFLRGAAAVMARDIAAQPSTGLRVQCCGDCHLLNFGAYGTPERKLVFDVNDFDETLAAPFEWDVKRLAASIHMAALDNGFAPAEARAAVMACVAQYRGAMHSLADMTNLQVWYSSVDVEQIAGFIANPAQRRRFEKNVRRTERRGNLQALGKLATVSTDGNVRIADQPPLVTHVPFDEGVDAHDAIATVAARYRTTLPDDRRRLFDTYRFVDTARKVVGVGSVGLDARIALFIGRDDSDPLFLQMKEARPSVLAPYAGASPYRHQGERVVQGQRLMQAASDMFLGWYTGLNRRQYYVRQLRDMKGSADVAAMSAEVLAQYGALCGGTLARAHARSGDSCMIAGYLGSGTQFDEATASFAADYAAQASADHAALEQAIEDHRITAVTGV